ncbi:hypothetical protein ACWDOP_00305 [Nocardia sp. NPDC003693]
MLFALPSLRLVLPDDAYSKVSSCWWGPDRFVAHAMALYDMHYRVLYLNRVVASIKRETFLRYLQAEVGVADFATGRNAHASMGYLMRKTGMSESTMHRGRQLLYKLGCRTVVFHGRQLTKDEALEQWRRDRPKMKGWTAVAALHETTVLPVDNSLVETLLEQGFGTPPSRSEVSAATSRRWVISPAQSTMKRSAPRRLDKRGWSEKCPAYDQKAVLLAASVLRDERFPLWVRRIPRKRLQALLTRKALADWTVDDVFAALEDWWKLGRVLLNSPTNPPGYLWTVLNEVPDDAPPARLDRARNDEYEANERAERAREREQARARAVAGPDSPGYLAARAVVGKAGQRAAEKKAVDRRAADQERYELAERRRN